MGSSPLTSSQPLQIGRGLPEPFRYDVVEFTVVFLHGILTVVFLHVDLHHERHHVHDVVEFTLLEFTFLHVDLGHHVHVRPLQDPDPNDGFVDRGGPAGLRIELQLSGRVSGGATWPNESAVSPPAAPDVARRTLNDGRAHCTAGIVPPRSAPGGTMRYARCAPGDVPRSAAR